MPIARKARWARDLFSAFAGSCEALSATDKREHLVHGGLTEEKLKLHNLSVARLSAKSFLETGSHHDAARVIVFISAMLAREDSDVT